MIRSERLIPDPVEVLVSSECDTVRTFAENHLSGKRNDLQSVALNDRVVQRILSAQRENGSWIAGLKNERHSILVASFKAFRTLVHRYELDRSIGEIEIAAEHLLTYQTDEGDIRGMIGGQYATYYTGEILSLLIRAGYDADERIVKGLNWLLEMRQDDGGWTIPILTRDLPWKEVVRLTAGGSEPLLPDRSRPFSHNWTDMVLRAFSAHPSYRMDRNVRFAAELLKGSFFQSDAYRSYRDTRYWTRFVAWWPNLLTAMETLTDLGYDGEDKDVRRGISWFVENIRDDGLWELERGRPGKRIEREWLSLRICRMLRNLDALGGE